MLTISRQKQLICDFVATGEPPGVDSRSFQPDLRVILDDLIAGDYPTEFQRHQRLYYFKMLNMDRWGSWVDAIMSLTPGTTTEHLSLGDFGHDLTQVTWLWPNWIPRGLLSVLAADAGVGKTNVSLDLCRRVCNIMPAPDGAELGIKSAKVVYVDAEGFMPIIYRRLKAWEADLTSFYPLERPEREGLDLSTEQYQDQLTDMCHDLKPDMVVIDSLSTIHPKGENGVEDMRYILAYLVDLAGAMNTAILLIHHLRKPSQAAGGIVTMHDLRGSTHLTAMARSIIGLHIANGDPNGPRRLKVLKTNLCPTPVPLSITYQPSPIDEEVAIVVYEGERPADLIAETSTVDAAAVWLKELLRPHAGGLPYKDILGLANEAGFNKTALLRARHKLDWQITYTLGARVTGNCWQLQEAGDDEIPF